MTRARPVLSRKAYTMYTIVRRVVYIVYASRDTGGLEKGRISRIVIRFRDVLPLLADLS
jgi:hypothetical protein